MLYERNITSEELLQWSSTIDLAERYQIYTEHAKNGVTFEDDQLLFYNCSWPWFGPFCQFAFEYSDVSFNSFVKRFFQDKIPAYNTSMITCYLHLQCETLLTCLDWRDICNGKMDCLDGTDESDCWPLEMNQCTDKEYRCHNGQCIPKDFLSDDSTYSDCLDQSDESITRRLSWPCFEDPSFPCEERTCRSGLEEFSCGDGQCISEMGRTCFNGKGDLLSNDSCLNAMNCLMKIIDGFEADECDQFCSNVDCIYDYCEVLFEYPSEPVLFGHVRLMFETEKLINNIFLPSYVCYNEELCKDVLSDPIYLNNSACLHIDQLKLSEMNIKISLKSFIRRLKNIFRGCSTVPNGTYDCNHINAYRCKNSTKCISKYRLVDGIKDCLYGDDETYNASCELNDKHHRVQCFNDEKRCFARSIIENGYADCPERDDEEPEIMFIKQHIYFQTICNGDQELLPIIIDGRNETDETECEHWPCNNTYNRCNGFWSCYNGADEINCNDSFCPSFQHTCIFPNDHNKLQCLPLNRTGDGIIDCLGASDERQYCRILHPNELMRFYCWNDTKCIHTYKLCDRIQDCKFGDDEQFCTNDTISLELGLCHYPITEIEKSVCNIHDFLKNKEVYFKLQNMPIYPRTLTNNITKQFSIDTSNLLLKSKLDIDIENNWIARCNRGLNIRVRINGSENESQGCLCPPSYYGETCQYQNERVSIILQLHVVSDWRTLFTVLILLLDHEGKVHSHDWIEYLPIRDCHTKFHVYLLYSTRPKDKTKNYTVRIDIFNKLTLNYRASWIFPILFSFLPVYRLAIQLTIPILSIQPTQHCPLTCIHGQCIKYTNTENMYFCQCDRGWSGSQCSIAFQCNCSPDSLCIDHSICICPVTKFGSLCYLNRISCKGNLCLNNGFCVPEDVRQEIADGRKYNYSCICTEYFEGYYCEYRKTRIDISFEENFPIPESLFIHFIEIFDNSPHIQTTMMKRISPHQTELTVYTTTEFEVAFAQIQTNYYLIFLRELYIVGDISTQISVSQKCVSIRELFNTTIANQHLLRRIKHYHIPCQQRNELICFYDDVYLCLCDLSRYANCFEFNFNITYDCHGLNPCENGGYCFQDRKKCPTSIICVCDTCFYGTRCQFSTKGFHPSLDAILGYQIRPNLGLNKQSIAVKVSIVFTIIIFIFGLINGFLLMITFHRKQTRNTGCDFYLFVSSIISIIIMHVFLLKTCFLLTIQMNLITNRLFILLQCRSTDFILRSLVSINDWLHACIAIERIMVLKKVSFNKKKSKKAAKWTSSILILVVTCTHIQEPLYRHLIDDEEDQRTWCAIRLSTRVQAFDSTINLLYFLLPFSINVISALATIVITARTRSNIQKKKTYKEHFYQQLEMHKHLLISPSIIVLLASPRLIIALSSECMKSVRDPWLFLSGYFISFLSSIMTFPVFVLPSQVYKEYFSKSIKSFHCC